MRTTHDINLDHHGLLDPSKIDGGIAGTTAVGHAFGRYYGTDSIASVLASLDERITASSRGYNIMAGSFTISVFVQPWFSAGAWIATVFTANAVIAPHFTVNAVIG